MMPAASLSRRLRRHWALAVVCAAFLLAATLTFANYTRHTYDGAAERAIGNAPLDYLAGDGERAFDRLYNYADRYYGVVVETPIVLIERALERVLGDRPDQRAKHIPMHLFFLFGGVCCYLLVLRLFGNRALALIAMVLFLLHPRIYAHSFINPKDVPFLVMFMIALYLTHRAFRRETLGAFILCGAVVGLLVNLRVMGLVLFVAVLALRALDLAFAEGADGRKRVLLAGVGFALAGVLAYYASLPALWTDPFGRFTELLGILGSHPYTPVELFRGEWRYTASGPSFDYVPVWIAITTPPATLALVLAGAVALAWGALRRPRDLLRNGPPRFGLLLAALPVVTVVAVVMLENNFYDDWRHLSFLYAPLLLLAVHGIHGIMESAVGGRGRGWPRTGAYALAAAAVAVALVSMVRIHPHTAKALYFNSLTDRVTPEGLSSAWEPEHWLRQQLLVATFADVAADYPAGPLSYASTRWRPGPNFTAEERERFVPTHVFRSGERNFFDVRHDQWCPDLPGTRERRLYSLLLACVVDPVAYLGGYRRQALAAEPLARARFDAYRLDGVMVYVREGCEAEDMELRFFLRVYPVAVEDLPDRLREFPGHRGAYGFEKRDFAFAEYGASIDGNCVAVVRLPDYAIAHIETGQYTPAWGEAARRAVADAEPMARSRFAVWLDAEGRRLTWVRDGCSAEDTGERFFLHVYPVEAEDLPEWREEYGFENYNFQFGEHGVLLGDGSCVVTTPLPTYPIASIETSQGYGGALWSARFAYAPPEIDADLLAREPLARSVFDVWRDGDALVYVRERCTEEEAGARFGLHLYPVDEGDLTAARREHGFENRDFFLWERGARPDGRCVAVAPLPSWPIARVETGQYDEGGRRWWVELELPE